MAAIDDLTELVERAAAAERSVLAAKWKDRSDVEATIRRAHKAAEDQRAAIQLDRAADRLSPRWAELRQTYLDLGLSNGRLRHRTPSRPSPTPRPRRSRRTRSPPSAWPGSR